jgi:hypothetical protein
MIQLSRWLARRVRSVFRKLVTRSNSDVAKLSITTGSDGVHFRLHRTDIVAEYHEPGEQPAAEVFLPVQALADFEGKSSEELVTLEVHDKGIVQASWNDGDVPQVNSYEAEDPAKLPSWPKIPEGMSRVNWGILKALAEASQSVSHDGTRFAINNIQLKGSSGAIIATDGRQLLRKAFELPWKEDVLVPGSSVFGSKELQVDEVSIGKTDSHVVMQMGSWSLYLPIDKEGRYPNASSIIPKQDAAVAHCHIDLDDAEFLDKALERLPGASDEHAPITLDLDGKVIIRAKAEGQEQVVELVLGRSEVTGKSMRMAINRHFLSRALHLDVTDIYFQGADKPILFKSEWHDFVVMPLVDAALILGPCDKAVQITSVLQTNGESRTKPNRRNIVNEPTNRVNETDSVPANNGNGNGNGKATRTRKSKSTGLAALIEEAESLKSAVREIGSRSHKLVIALKRHRKQSRLMQTSLKALKDLQQIEA